MRLTRATMALMALAACDQRGSTPTEHVLSTHEVGIIEDPPGASGRDVGVSVGFGGHSVWAFGDTFFAEPAADGYTWRGSSWSWTDDDDASDGLSGWHHALGSDGKPLSLLPHTAGEQAFDDAHNGSPCPAVSDCGARHTAWPGATVDDGNGGALVAYALEDTEPTGSFAFKGVGTSLATWSSPEVQATRQQVANAPDPSEPTALFDADDLQWNAAMTRDGDSLYVYACPGGGTSSPCRLAKVAVETAFDRSTWTFWNGKTWSGSVKDATKILDGAPIMSVHYSEYLQQWVAYYTVPLTTTLALRLALRPEGPWSNEERFAEGAKAMDGTWDYGLVAHHELARDSGQVEYVSYFQPGAFLDGHIRLVEVRYR